MKIVKTLFHLVNGLPKGTKMLARKRNKCQNRKPNEKPKLAIVL